LVIPKNDKWVNTMRKDMRDMWEMIDKVKN
jgi:hypothetical protein